MIKHLTYSALTGGVMVLAYAAWSKWRATPPKLEVTAPPQIDHAPETDSVDVALDDLWETDEPAVNPNEQLVDFSSDLSYEEDEGSVAPEGLGVRWLTRATEAMSPFHHALSIREEAEAALLGAVTRRGEDEAERAPESSAPLSDLDFDLDFESEPPPRTEPQPEYTPNSERAESSAYARAENAPSVQHSRR
jgi:hypothetical protein